MTMRQMMQRILHPQEQQVRAVLPVPQMTTVPESYWVVDPVGWYVDIAPSMVSANRLADHYTETTMSQHTIQPAMTTRGEAV